MSKRRKRPVVGSANVSREWFTSMKRSKLLRQLPDELDRLRAELGLIRLWVYATCEGGPDATFDGALGDFDRVVHHAGWEVPDDEARRYLLALIQAGLIVEHGGDYWVHDFDEWQSHAVVYRKRVDGGRRGGPSGTETTQKGAPSMAENAHKSAKTPQKAPPPEAEAEAEAEKTEDPPTPPQGGSTVPATSDVDEFAKGWQALCAKHPDLKGLRLPLAKGVRAKLAKALAHTDVRPYWRQALTILHEHGPSQFVLDKQLGWVWFLRTRARDGGPGPAMAIVEAGEWLADKRPPGARPSSGPPQRETAVQRQRRLTKQLQESQRRDREQREGGGAPGGGQGAGQANPDGQPQLRIVNGRAVYRGD